MFLKHALILGTHVLFSSWQNPPYLLSRDAETFFGKSIVCRLEMMLSLGVSAEVLNPRLSKQCSYSRASLFPHQCDLSPWAMSRDQVDRFSKENGFTGWTETSVKENKNVNEAMR